MAKKPTITFDEVPDQREIKIRDHSGNLRTYTLREMDDDQLGVYMSLRAGRAKRTKSRNPDGYRGALAELIHLCLYDSSGSPVPEQVLRSWSVKTQFGLFELCLEMNGLSDSTVTGDEEEELEKNSAGVGTAGGNGVSPNPAAPAPVN